MDDIIRLFNSDNDPDDLFAFGNQQQQIYNDKQLITDFYF